MTDPDNPAMADLGQQLETVVAGSAGAAAAALEAAFAQAGASIEASLSQAADRGRLDFEAMAQSIARDLARLAGQSLFAPQPGAAQQTFNVNLAGGNASGARSVLANQGALQSALSRAVLGIGRAL